MSENNSFAVNAVQEVGKLGVMVVCWFVLLDTLSLTGVVLAFLGIFFGGFIVGVFEADWEVIEPEGMFRPMLYLFILLGGAFALALNPILATVGLILFGITVSDGYNAHTRYRNGEQPYQKYEWFPRNAMKFPLIPYYYYKHEYKTTETES